MSSIKQLLNLLVKLSRPQSLTGFLYLLVSPFAGYILLYLFCPIVSIEITALSNNDANIFKLIFSICLATIGLFFFLIGIFFLMLNAVIFVINVVMKIK